MCSFAAKREHPSAQRSSAERRRITENHTPGIRLLSVARSVPATNQVLVKATPFRFNAHKAFY
jgi:hypothetical protein